MFTSKRMFPCVSNKDIWRVNGDFIFCASGFDCWDSTSGAGGSFAVVYKTESEIGVAVTSHYIARLEILVAWGSGLVVWRYARFWGTSLYLKYTVEYVILEGQKSGRTWGL